MRSRPAPYGRLPRNGTVTPLAVLSLSLLVGVVALSIDGGTLMEDRRHVQAAADAAALAAAADLFVHYPSNQGLDLNGTARASALAIAAANGFGNGGDDGDENSAQSLVTVNIAPQTYQAGPNAGQPLPPGYVEVIVQYNANRLFSGVFGSGVTPVRGRAVARGQWVPVQSSVIVLSPSQPGAFSTTGNGSVRIKGGLQVNSSSSISLNLHGNAMLSASSIHVNSSSGSRLLQSLSSFFQSLGGTAPTISSGGIMPDPLRFLPPPNPVQLGLSQQATNFQVNSGTVNLYPGVYSGGISASGNAKIILHANPDGTPGIYYLQGQNGLSVSSSAGITTAANETGGVMIYNDWQDGSDSINLTSSGIVSLTPPISGPYQGISLFQKRGTPTMAAPLIDISGHGNVNITGTVYGAYTPVRLDGLSGSNVMGGQIIADTLSVNGNASVSIDSSGAPTANTRILGLVE